MNRKMPIEHVRQIVDAADICATKALSWKARALAAETRLAAPPPEPQPASNDAVRDALARTLEPNGDNRDDGSNAFGLGVDWAQEQLLARYDALSTHTEAMALLSDLIDLEDLAEHASEPLSQRLLAVIDKANALLGSADNGG